MVMCTSLYMGESKYGVKAVHTEKIPDSAR